ncbi:MAG: TonB-dependent receptor, partial [Bacteroidetes bacterium]
MKTIVLRLLSLALILTSYAAVAQTGKIAGKVIDKKNGEELIGVSLQIEGTNIGAATDFEGKFLISGVQPGTYNLVISYVAYKKKIITGVEVKAKETTMINVSMEESTKELKEAVIYGEVKKESTNSVLIQQKNAVVVSSGVS